MEGIMAIVTQPTAQGSSATHRAHGGASEQFRYDGEPRSIRTYLILSWGSKEDLLDLSTP